MVLNKRLGLSMSTTITGCFEAQHYADRITVINPRGDVGVVTLWTPVDTAINILQRCGVDLNSTRIAAVANLYGDGLPQMLRNLLWNPQIRHLLIFGQDLSGSADELMRFMHDGVEVVEVLGNRRYRIVGTTRTLDTNFPPELLVGRITVRHAVGKPSSSEVHTQIASFFQSLPAQVETMSARVDAPLPIYKPRYYPSNPRGHTIVRPTPIDAWEEVVCRIMRYGVPSIASKTKQRLELQNLKVVIEHPNDTDDAILESYGFKPDEFRAYARSLLDPRLPEGLHYSYGNRIRDYGPQGESVDQLTACCWTLTNDPTSRDAYITLWDPIHDNVTTSSPCLVTLFFRVFQDKLTLTATFRSHNVMSAWLKHVHGLMALQRYVANFLPGIPCGAITVISQSISIDPTSTDRMDLATQISTAKVDDRQLNRRTGKRELREDPNGYFTFTVDRESGEIVACLKCGGETLATYRGRTAEMVEQDIARDAAISDIGHALYVGRQLSILETSLRKGGQE